MFHNSAEKKCNYGSQPDDDDLIRFHRNATQAKRRLERVPTSSCSLISFFRSVFIMISFCFFGRPQQIDITRRTHREYASQSRLIHSSNSSSFHHTYQINITMTRSLMNKHFWARIRVCIRQFFKSKVSRSEVIIVHCSFSTFSYFHISIRLEHVFNFSLSRKFLKLRLFVRAALERKRFSKTNSMKIAASTSHCSWPEKKVTQQTSSTRIRRC